MKDDKKKKSTKKKSVKRSAKPTAKKTTAKKVTAKKPTANAKKKPAKKTAPKTNAVEIDGFNEALKRSAAKQKVKEINKRALDRRIKELEDAGVSKDIAKIMAKTERDYNLRPRH